jgi:hypothetical protein
VRLPARDMQVPYIALHDGMTVQIRGAMSTQECLDDFQDRNEWR